MATPIEKIASGLDELEANKRSSKTRLAALAKAPGTTAGLKLTLVNVIKARDSLTELRDSNAANLADFKAKASAEWADRGWVDSDSGRGRTDLMGVAQRRKYIETDVAKYRRAQIEETDAARIVLVTELHKAKGSLALVGDFYSSPLSHLMISTLTSSERATQTANLASAGPIELNRAMALAVMTNSPDLAAACCARMDNLNKEARKSVTVSKNDLALQVAGDEWARNAEILAVAKYVIGSAELVGRELAGQKVSPVSRIGIGRALYDVEAKLGRKLIDENGEIMISEADRALTFNEYLDARGFTGIPGSGKALNVVGDDGQLSR